MIASPFVLSLPLCLAGAVDALDNLDFSAGSLAGWKGNGFSVAVEPGQDGRRVFAVTSRDGDRPGRTGRLERTLRVPAGAVFLRCRAHAAAVAGSASDRTESGGKVDMLLRSGDRIIPKQVHAADGWRSVLHVRTTSGGHSEYYSWSVANYAGRTVQLVLLDGDTRPGCHLHCSSFRFLTRSEVEAQEFSQFMLRLQKQHQLAPMARYDTPHFTALSNAEDEFSKARLQNCETLYRRFFDHFRRKGMAVREPATKLMVAIFATEAGFKTYLGPSETRSVQGVYDTKTNRLVIYDYRDNRQFLAHQQKLAQVSKRIRLQLNREQYLGTVDRLAREHAADQNISLVIHETAHQLSFNGGLFNRAGDAPFWAVEGLACYCEPTDNGLWLGIGQPNPDRLRQLAQAKGRLLPLRQLVTGDGWKAGSQRETLLFYAQSWALFHLLMEERPQLVGNYLKLIWPRRTPDHRLTDFRQTFGSDLAKLEQRLARHVQHLLERHGIPRE